MRAYRGCLLWRMDGKTQASRGGDACVWGGDACVWVGLVAAEGAYDVDGVVDDAGAGVDDDGVSVAVAALVADGDGW